MKRLFTIRHALSTMVVLSLLVGVSGIGWADSIDSFIGGDWLEFAFGGTGLIATGCSPADPGGPGCFPSSGGNSSFAPAPAWTFTSTGSAGVTLVDAFLLGDAFELFDFGTSIGTTSSPGTGSCGSDPVGCLIDPDASKGFFALGSGSHALTIEVLSSPFGGGAAYFRVDATQPSHTPEPGTWMLLSSGLLGLAGYTWRRRK